MVETELVSGTVDDWDTLEWPTVWLLGPAASLDTGPGSQLTQNWVDVETAEGDLIIGTLPHFEQILSVKIYRPM